jgi:hypothetical protein
MEDAKMKHLFLAVLMATLACTACTWAADTKPASSYPLDTCVVSGEKLGAMGAPFVVTVKGREVRLCCSGCKAKLEASPDEYIKKIDDAVILKEKAAYPLDTCVVTGQKLAATAVDHVMANNRLVRLCCKDCIAVVDKDPAKYTAIIDKAAPKKK